VTTAAATSSVTTLASATATALASASAWPPATATTALTSASAWPPATATALTSASRSPAALPPTHGVHCFFDYMLITKILPRSPTRTHLSKAVNRLADFTVNRFRFLHNSS
jgi:hypothetical protein